MSSSDQGTQRMTLHMPSGFFDLPPYIQELVLGDRQDGEAFLCTVLRLCESGMPYDEAKAQVLPHPENRGASFHSVYKLAHDLPMIVSVGSAAQSFEESHGTFIRSFQLATSLLGVSSCDGGGPGVMRLNSQTKQESITRTADLDWLARRYAPELFQVLLHSGNREKPNGFCPQTHRVWPIRNLKKRTAMLFSLGRVLGMLMFPGGGGTGEEGFRWLTDGQLSSLGAGQFKRLLPIIMLDFTMKNGQRFFDGHRIMFENMLSCGTIKEQDFNSQYYVEVDRPDALQKALTIIDDSFRVEFGFPLIQDWEEANERSLVETVRELETASTVEAGAFAA